MQLIRCTQKLLRVIGIKKSDLIDDDPKFGYLRTWYANLIWIDRRKCVLFTNEETLYSFLVTDVKKTDLSKIERLFVLNLRANLASEKFDSQVIDKVLKEYSEIVIAKTKSKSVLGSMNDLAFHCKFSVLRDGGVTACDIIGINQELNRIPIGAIGYSYSIERLRIKLKQLAT
jgi:phosphoribosyl-ATP pyrophosphohydrolase